jgi:hypothetical protein
MDKKADEILLKILFHPLAGLTKGEKSGTINCMKRIIVMVVVFTTFIAENAFSQAETGADLFLYASTQRELLLDFAARWKFPFLQGESPFTSGNNIALKLDANLSPLSAGLSGEAALTVAPFLSFTIGAMTGTGWNYDLFGEVPLVGLGLNRKMNDGDAKDGVSGNGLDGAVWNVHAGNTIQFDFAAIFPGDWNHVVVQVYNAIQYYAYTNATGDEFWYYQMDDGMNQNAFRYKFEAVLGYAMPLFVDLVGVRFSGTLPFYNIKTGATVRDIGFSLDAAFLVNFNINKHFSIMTLACFSNDFTDPVARAYEREWAFDRVQLVATWHIK